MILLLFSEVREFKTCEVENIGDDSLLADKLVVTGRKKLVMTAYLSMVMKKGGVIIPCKNAM